MREKRISSRIERLLPFWYRMPGDLYRVGALLDLSRWGARLVLDRRPEGPFSVTLQLDNDFRISGEAHPQWMRSAEDGTHLVGVELRLRGPGRHLIGPWVQRNLRSQQTPRPRRTSWQMAGEAGRRWRTGRAWRKPRVPSSDSTAP